MWKKKFRGLLKETLGHGQGNSSKMTLRALAKSVGISPGALSGIISGKRSFSERAAQQILGALEIDSEIKREFEERFKNETSGKRVLLGREFEVLISKWFYLSILCLFEFENPPQTAQEIAERLGLTVSEAIQALSYLSQMGLLQKDESGRLEYIGPYWTTTDEISSDSVKQAHLNELSLAGHALLKAPMEERDFTSITFAGNSLQLKKVKKEIRKFRDRVNQIMEEGDCDQVYKFNIQIFSVDGLGAES